MPTFLAIETTCDETAAAVFTEDARVLSNVVASQAALHARYGGVVPEIASRAHLERILPVIDDALQQAGVKLADLDGVAVAYTPGLIGAILVGLTAAKALALACDIPLIGIHHLHGHIYACQMVHPEPVFPCVGLIISGGHTSLYSCACPTDMTLVGSTTDDAAGEAFDKVASILGLGYPGGPAIERAAKAGDARAYDFPRSLIDEDNLDFSFSGLKTAVLYTVWGQNAKDRGRVLSEREVADVAASFQEAVIDVLVEKARRAVRQMGVGTLCVGGGVAAHRRLRSRLVAMADEERVRLVIAPVEYCTDNAAMAAVAVEKWKRGEFSPLDLDAGGGLERRT